MSIVGVPLAGASGTELKKGIGGQAALKQGGLQPQLQEPQAPPSGGDDMEEAGGKPDEYQSPVTAMLKQVHKQLQKDGGGLPGFNKPPQGQSGSPQNTRALGMA